jgi:colicin import membrane protein
MVAFGAPTRPSRPKRSKEAAPRRQILNASPSDGELAVVPKGSGGGGHDDGPETGGPAAARSSSAAVLLQRQHIERCHHLLGGYTLEPWEKEVAAERRAQSRQRIFSLATTPRGKASAVRGAPSASPCPAGQGSSEHPPLSLPAPRRRGRAVKTAKEQFVGDKAERKRAVAEAEEAAAEREQALTGALEVKRAAEAALQARTTLHRAALGELHRAQKQARKQKRAAEDEKEAAAANARASAVAVGAGPRMLDAEYEDDYEDEEEDDAEEGGSAGAAVREASGALEAAAAAVDDASARLLLARAAAGTRAAQLDPSKKGGVDALMEMRWHALGAAERQPFQQREAEEMREMAASAAQAGELRRRRAQAKAAAAAAAPSDPAAAAQAAPVATADSAVLAFAARQAAAEAARRRKLEAKRRLAEYALRQGKRCCPTCGAEQSLDEVQQKRAHCPGCEDRGVAPPSARRYRAPRGWRGAISRGFLRRLQRDLRRRAEDAAVLRALRATDTRLLAAPPAATALHSAHEQMRARVQGVLAASEQAAEEAAAATRSTAAAARLEAAAAERDAAAAAAAASLLTVDDGEDGGGGASGASGGSGGGGMGGLRGGPAGQQAERQRLARHVAHYERQHRELAPRAPKPALSRGIERKVAACSDFHSRLRDDARVRAANAARPALAEALSVPQGGLSPAILALGALFHTFGRHESAAAAATATAETATTASSVTYSLCAVERGLRAANARQTNRALVLGGGDIEAVMALLRLADAADATGEGRGRCDGVPRAQLGRWAAVCGEQLAIVDPATATATSSSAAVVATNLPRRIFKAIVDLVATTEEALAKKRQHKARFA